MHAAPSPITKHKQEDKIHTAGYIPSENFQICWTTCNNYSIPLTPNCVNLGNYGQQKCDLDPQRHSSNMCLWKNISVLTCNGNVCSGDEAPTDF